jgi:hypothetical protein
VLGDVVWNAVLMFLLGVVVFVEGGGDSLGSVWFLRDYYGIFLHLLKSLCAFVVLLRFCEK